MRVSSQDPPEGGNREVEERGPGDRRPARVVDIGVREENLWKIHPGVESPANVVLGVSRRKDHRLAIDEDPLEAEGPQAEGQQEGQQQDQQEDGTTGS